MNSANASESDHHRLDDSFGFIENQRKTLEDAFFLKEDRKLIEDLKKMRAMKETKQALSEISGIKNDAVLEKMVELNVRPETLASLSLVPLVEVAWADGQIDEKEKDALLQAANSCGRCQGNIDYEIINQWLSHKPAPGLLAAWTHYLEGLCEKLSKTEQAALQSELLGQATMIAEASGGILGLGIGSRISKEESATLKKLEGAFKKCG